MKLNILAIIAIAAGSSCQTGVAAGRGPNCLDKIDRVAMDRATQILRPDFPLRLVNTYAFSPTLYRVSFHDFVREVRADVEVDEACNIVAISIDEDSEGNG